MWLSFCVELAKTLYYEDLVCIFGAELYQFWPEASQRLSIFDIFRALE